MKIARISYLNTDPFFFAWPSDAPRADSGTPRSLSAAADGGTVDAGPLPVVDAWAMEPVFEPLGRFCIAAREACRSVFIFSRAPLEGLDGARIGLTHESSTSVALARVLFRLRYRVNPEFRRGFQDDDDARLVIGDAALRMICGAERHRWPHAADLASEWWRWKGLPFVFARWVVRASLPADQKEGLCATVAASLTRGLAAIDRIADVRSRDLALPASDIDAYLRGFTYQLGPQEEASMALFRDMLRETAAEPDVVPKEILCD